MAHVLISTNLNKNSLNTLMYGAGIAQTLNTPAKLLHAVPDTVSFVKGLQSQSLLIKSQSALERRCKIAKNYLNRVARGLNNQLGSKVVLKSKVVLDRVRSAIKNEIKEVKPSLVVIGATSDDSTYNKLFPTSGMLLARETKVPVLLVSEEVKNYQGINKILFIGREEIPKESVTSSLQEIIKNLNASLFILESEPLKHQAYKMRSNQVLDQIQSRKSIYHMAFKKECTPDHIIAYAKFIEADIIAIESKRPEIWEQLFQGDLAQKLLADSPIPILVY